MSAPILYCILTHAFPRQTLRLLRAIYNETDLFVIHVDRSATPDYIDLIRSRAAPFLNIHVISNHVCSWGGFSLVATEIDMLKTGFAVETTPWTHAVFLSGTHLPAWPREKIRAWLVEDESCINWFEFPQTETCPEDKWGMAIWSRFNWYYEEEPGTGMKKIERAPPLGFIYGTGSQWVALARAHAGFALRPESDLIRTRLATTDVADEAYFQTILANSSYRDQRAPQKNHPYGMGRKAKPQNLHPR